MNDNRKLTTTIRVSPDLRDFLAKQAIKKNESYEDIIKRLIKDIWKTEVKTAK